MKTKNLLAIPSILTACAGLFLLSSVIYFTACSSNQQPVGIVYPPSRVDVPRAVVVEIEATGRWVWQITADNNRLIAQSEQDFATAPAAMENYRDVRASMTAWPDAEPISNLKL